MKKIWARRIFVLKAAGIGAIAGLIIAFSIPKEYTTTVKMAPEGINATKGGGMADLAALAGFDLSSGSGNNVDGINLMLYPDVVNSTPFMVDLSQIPVQGKKMPAAMSLYDYVDTQLSSPWWKYLLAVPGKIIGWISFAEKEEEANGINPYALTQQQSEVLKKQNERINISVDKKTGVITASATMQDPLVTAAVADSMVNKLQEYILTYRTEKAVRDLAFTRNLFDEAKQKYYDAQRKYAIAGRRQQTHRQTDGTGGTRSFTERTTTGFRRLQPTGPATRNGQNQGARANPLRNDHRTGDRSGEKIEHQQGNHSDRIRISGSLCGDRKNSCQRSFPKKDDAGIIILPDYENSGTNLPEFFIFPGFYF